MEIGPDHGVTYLHHDHLGSLTMASGLENGLHVVLGKRMFDELGQSHFEEQGYVDEYGFTGQELDSSTGLNHFDWRYYDPQKGRWLSSDPLFSTLTESNLGRLGESTTAYAYVAGNWLTAFDNTGLAKFKEVFTALDKLAGMVDRLNAYASNKDFVNYLNSSGTGSGDRLGDYARKITSDYGEAYKKYVQKFEFLDGDRDRLADMEIGDSPALDAIKAVINEFEGTSYTYLKMKLEYNSITGKGVVKEYSNGKIYASASDDAGSGSDNSGGIVGVPSGNTKLKPKARNKRNAKSKSRGSVATAHQRNPSGNHLTVPRNK